MKTLGKVLSFTFAFLLSTSCTSSKIHKISSTDIQQIRGEVINKSFYPSKSMSIPEIVFINKGPRTEWKKQDVQVYYPARCKLDIVMRENGVTRVYTLWTEIDSCDSIKIGSEYVQRSADSITEPYRKYR
ncbi:MAG: hypothetical protein HY730_00285 [Candidatus Tectomicrobia bacterium]|uniref:Lipoprotein n=1 Tax=Tectimicrobiota bacterium TaxID=2528274 RepID=A0A933GJ54_UNCTE|nr:hypothetical protein [Candidatus Tectomicrobia bacterium]